MGEPNTMKFGLGDSSIPGLDQGIIGMCVGESRKIKVPPALGHGGYPFKADFLTIPADSTLEFKVELKNVGMKQLTNGEGKKVSAFTHMDTDKDGKLTPTEMDAF